MIKKLISGGQTGADTGGLLAASALNIPTGGWAPKHWLREDGPAPWLADYGLKECKGGSGGGSGSYADRTALNVKESDGTLLFGNVSSTGSKLTMDLCGYKSFNKPLFIVPYPLTENAPQGFMADWVRRWIEQWKIQVLNVAGNRESKAHGIEEFVVDFLFTVFS